MHHFDGIAKASYRRGMSIISLICNVQRTSEILERVRARLPVAVPKLQPARGS